MMYHTGLLDKFHELIRVNFLAQSLIHCQYPEATIITISQLPGTLNSTI